MKKAILILISVVIVVGASSQQNNHSGVITSDTIWSDTVNIVGNVFVNEEVSLSINPGTCIRFLDYYKMEVEGIVVSLGNINDSIRFTVIDTTGFYDISNSNGGWKGIKLRNSNHSIDTSIFSFCHFQYAKPFNIDTSGPNGSAITAFANARVKILNSSFSFNKGHIKGGAYNGWDSSYSYISHSNFHHNYSTFEAGALMIYRADGEIYNNMIHHNISEFMGGGLCSMHSNVEIHNNLIVNNFAGYPYHEPEIGKGGAIKLSYGNTRLINNVICNNTSHSGGAFIIKYGEHLLLNNTIANNHAYSQIAAIDCNQSVQTTIKNCIVYGNTSDDGIQIISNGSSQISHCNVEGGINGEFNINADPRFINPTLHAGYEHEARFANWNLIQCSAGINKGENDSSLPNKDYNGNPRIMNSIVDMGSMEYQPATDGSYISGHISMKDSSFTDGIIHLYQYANRAEIELDDVVEIDSLGNYSFEALCDGSYIVLALPEETNEEEILKTYYSRAYNWETASVVNFEMGSSQSNINIDMLELPYLDGDLEIRGLVVDVFEEPMDGIEVLLKRVPDSIYARTYTSDQGIFLFRFLPVDTYEILVDIPGIPMDSIYIVVLDKKLETMYKYIVDSNRVYIPRVDGYQDLFSDDKFNVYPNPSQTYIVVSSKNKKDRIHDIKLLNFQGQPIYEKININEELIRIDMSSYPRGVYFIEVKALDYFRTFKIVK